MTITIVGMGYGHEDLSANGHRALNECDAIIHTSEFASSFLSQIAPAPILVPLQSRPELLEQRDGFYCRVTQEIMALAQRYESVCIPTRGNPFVIEGLSTKLQSASSERRVIVYPGPSIIERLLCRFPTLLCGHGFHVIDTSNELFSARLNPLLDAILLQYSRVGSKRHTLMCKPNRMWHMQFINFLELYYPPSSMFNVVTVAHEYMVHSAKLSAASDLFEHISSDSTIVVQSPFKLQEHEELTVLSRLVTPVEMVLSNMTNRDNSNLGDGQTLPS